MYYMAVNKIRAGAEQGEISGAISSHIAWTKRMIASGTMVQAGRWGEGGGMAILRAESLEQARELVEQDPLVASGWVDLELARLYPDVEIK